MPEIQSKFKFKGYRVIKSELHLSPDTAIDKKLNANFTGIKGFESDNDYILDLGAEISNSDKSLSIAIELRGIFEFDRALNDKEKSAFFSGSAPAILFPYIRAHISMLTSISGIEPIVLPTLNFSAAVKKQRNNN